MAWWVIGYADRRKLKQLGAEIRVTADMGRAYLDLIDRRGYWTMADWLAFVETFSLFLLRHGDILHPKVRMGMH